MPIRIRIRIRNFKTRSGDPGLDPDPKKIGPDPQHWSLVCTSTSTSTSVIYLTRTPQCVPWLRHYSIMTTQYLSALAGPYPPRLAGRIRLVEFGLGWLWPASQVGKSWPGSAERSPLFIRSVFTSQSVGYQHLRSSYNV